MYNARVKLSRFASLFPSPDTNCIWATTETRFHLLATEIHFWLYICQNHALCMTTSIILDSYAFSTLFDSQSYCQKLCDEQTSNGKTTKIDSCGKQIHRCFGAIFTSRLQSAKRMDTIQKRFCKKKTSTSWFSSIWNCVFRKVETQQILTRF